MTNEPSKSFNKSAAQTMNPMRRDSQGRVMVQIPANKQGSHFITLLGEVGRGWGIVRQASRNLP